MATKYEIIKIDNGSIMTWAHLKDAHEIREALPYFIKMNHPEDFYLLDTERDKMFPVPYVYDKMKEWYLYD